MKRISIYGIEDISPYLKTKIIITRNSITNIIGDQNVKSKNQRKRVRLSQLQR